MNREAIEVGAFTWSRVQRLYDADPTAHWRRCAAEGLECSQEVFAQLFHDTIRALSANRQSGRDDSRQNRSQPTGTCRFQIWFSSSELSGPSNWSGKRESPF